jgi:4-hydroxy-tetrahydrodipicolinate synthase
MQLPLKGIIPPVITPLINYDELDIQGVYNLIEHLISGGVHGLFVLGTNGEAPSLSYKLRKELIKLVCEIADHRIPVLIGVSDTSIEGSIDIAEASGKAGADAVVVAPPYYYPVDQEEMVEYFSMLVSKLSIPFLLYNMPSHTKVHLNIDTVKKAKELGALGIKDSSGDMFYLYSLIEEFRSSPEFSIITGTELFLPDTIMNGGHGAIPGGANMFPRLFVKLYEACVNNDSDTINRLRKKVMEFYNTIYRVSKHPSSITMGIKCALSCMNICSDYLSPPLTRLNPAEREHVEKLLTDINQKQE